MPGPRPARQQEPPESRQQIIGATLLVVAGVMMILWKRNEWVVCLTIAAVLEMYTAFRIPQEEEKEKNK